MLNKKNKVIILSFLSLLVLVLIILLVIPDNKTHISYKEFKDRLISGDVATASINSKEILFNFKNTSR